MYIRDSVLFLLLFLGIPFIIRRPYIGVLYWAWIGLMNPHRLTYGAAYNFPFAVVVALATFVGLLFTTDERRWKAGPEVYLLIVFVLWMSITTLQALKPEAAAAMWLRVIKVQLMGLVVLTVLNSRRHIEILVWILALSVGYYGIKGGVFTLVTGGNYRVWGPDYSFIGDNNALALALVMTIPLFYFLYAEASRTWVKHGLAAAMLLCAFSVLGSYSRGALLAISAMVCFLWLRSHNKLALGLVLVLLTPLLLMFMPQQWEERMHTIGEYQQDSSANQRLNAWTMATRVANDRFLGGGFELYSRQIYEQYVPESPAAATRIPSAHSIYFQILGEHGWVGLVLFLLIWFFAWQRSRWIINISRNREDLKWAHRLSSMIQVSLVGYMVGGTFLNLGYWDLPYYHIILLVVMRDLIRRQLFAEGGGTLPEVQGALRDHMREGTERVTTA